MSGFIVFLRPMKQKQIISWNSENSCGNVRIRLRSTQIKALNVFWNSAHMVLYTIQHVSI